MRRVLTVSILGLAAGCSSKADKERMNDAGPPPVTQVGKVTGIPAMKPPGEGGQAVKIPPPGR